MTAPVLAAGRIGANGRREWRNNAEMIADVAELYIDLEHDQVLDPTFGKGNWWTEVRPRHLTASDLLKGDGDTVPRHDFTDLPHRDGSFAVVAFDPPYVSMGGRETSTADHTDDRFGMDTAPDSPDGVRDLIRAGIVEAERVLRRPSPGIRAGRLLVKCQDYVSSGHLQPGTHWAITDALATGGFRYVDRFEFVGPPPRQPSTTKCRLCAGTGRITRPPLRVDCEICLGSGQVPRRQVHARRNLSTLLVFERLNTEPSAHRLPLEG
ncbi:MAG: hypothetical protein AAGA90_20545 [Actinomycetota bacterium]